MLPDPVKVVPPEMAPDREIVVTPLRAPELIISPLIVLVAVAPVIAPDRPRVVMFVRAPVISRVAPAVDSTPLMLRYQCRSN
jgi:hypothetical protein